MNILHKISYDGHESVVRKPHSNCIMKSVSGEKISFSDGSDHPITRLVLSIDMNEDYNGYDKAWAGGEGKNLLPQFIQDGTYNGVTFTTNKDGSISSEGTATGAVYVASIRIALEAGTYYFTGTPAGGSAATYNSHADLYDGTTLLRSLGLDTGNGLSFTIAEEEAGKEAEFVLHIAEGVTAPEDTWKFFLCTEDIPFEPYENISTLIPYDQVVLKVNGHYYVQDLPEEFCAGFVDLIAGRIVSSYHTDHTAKAEQTNIQPREICTQPGENKMSMNVPGTIEVIYCVDVQMLIENSSIDTDITDPQDGQALVYSAEEEKWVNAAAKGGAGLEEITWADLKAKRDSGELTPGGQYRITDYVCTTTQDESRAVSHPFDIIVVADSESVLNENARAIAKDGDTYYQYADLSAWELKYCLDNDADRFKWADTTNGHGVVYYMKDDHNNECPYDFKQIQFKRYPITAAVDNSIVGMFAAIEYNFDLITAIDQNPIWFYTFSRINNDAENIEFVDNSSMQFNEDNKCISNVIEPFYNIFYTEEAVQQLQYLNNNVVIGPACNNEFKKDCHDNTIGTYGDYESSNNVIGPKCYANIFGDDSVENFLEYECIRNVFANSCSRISLNLMCGSNLFKSNCENIVLFASSNIKLGNRCKNNSFENGCNIITLDDDTQYNTFGKGCRRLHISGGTRNQPVSNYSFYGIEPSSELSLTEQYKSYETFVAMNSSGVLKTWVPADQAP